MPVQIKSGNLLNTPRSLGRKQEASLYTRTSRNDRVELLSFSRINRREGCILLRWGKNLQASGSLPNIQNVSSTLRKFTSGTVHLENESTSWKYRKIPAIVGPKTEPIEIPSTCLYIMLLKLNSTEVAANFINSTNTASRMSAGGGWVLLNDYDTTYLHKC